MDDGYARRKLARRRARRLMQGMAALCALVAVGAGADQLREHGLTAFLDRPPGVGATPPETADVQPGDGDAATALAPDAGDGQTGSAGDLQPSAADDAGPIDAAPSPAADQPAPAPPQAGLHAPPRAPQPRDRPPRSFGRLPRRGST